MSSAIDPTKPAAGIATTASVRANFLAAASEITALQAWQAAQAINVRAAPFNAAGDGVTDDTAAFAAALATGRNVHAPAGRYKLTAPLAINDGQWIIGDGCGLWDVIDRTRAKTWEGTTLLFAGTGAQTRNFYGITGMPDAGGVRTVGAVTAKLTGFMNSDASGATRATPRTFSAAIYPATANGSRHWGLRDLRICNWSGSDGISDHSNTATSSLGDAWDVGVLLQDAEYVTLERVQVVGGWRLAALAMVQPGLTAYGHGERNTFRDCKFQGYVGALLRAADVWKVTGTTANSLTIRHNVQHYWPTTGTFERLEGGTDPTYTGLSYSAPGLTFTGVSPDPTGTTYIRANKRGSGVAGTQFLDCLIHGLDHVSGNKATALGFTDPSKGLEISGFPMRGVQFYNSKVHSNEDVCAFLHDCDDTQFFGGQFEGSGLLIASPLESASTATAPAGQTYDLRFNSTLISGADTTGFTPRSIHDDLRQINPQSNASGHFMMAPLAGQDAIFQLASGQNFYVNRSTGANVFRVTETGNVLVVNGGQLSLQGGTAFINSDAAQNIQIRNGTTSRLTIFASSGSVAPGADATQNLGTATAQWASVFTKAVQFQAGTNGVKILIGTGAPAVSADVGSLYLRTDGGAGSTLYVKESGTGSSGWVAK